MKRFVSLLLTVLMTCCVVLTFAASPVFAKEDVVKIKSATELKNFLENISPGAEKYVQLTSAINLDKEIEIDESCTIHFVGKSIINLVNHSNFEIDEDNIHLIFEEGSVIEDKYGKSGTLGRVFAVFGDDCSISGLTFKDCRNDGIIHINMPTPSQGGFIGTIYVSDNDRFLLENCKFVNCSAGKDAGGIHIVGEDCTIRNCEFINCNAGYGGGIVFSGENNHVENCSFSNMSSSRGGAIVFDNDECTVTGCYFENCTAKRFGGAIYLSGDVDDVEISNCYFNKCTAGESGGAIELCSTCKRTKIQGCQFRECSSSEEGGAIDLCTGANFFFCFNCDFISCHSDTEGGAVYFGDSADYGVLEECDFIDCTAGGNGQCVRGSIDTLIRNCTPKSADNAPFYHCQFEDMSDSEAAPIRCSNWSELKSTIDGLASGAVVTIDLGQNAYFEPNETIDISKPCTITFIGENPRFSGETYRQRAFYLRADGVNINFGNVWLCYFPTSEVKGGAIYVRGNNCNITGGLFQACKAENGGAIYLDGCYCTITGSSFHYCEASDDGGAIYVNDDAVIDGCDFLDNIAGDCGGSIFDNNGPGEVVIKNCTFSGGSCGDDGIWVDCYGDAIIQNCTPGNNDYYNDPSEYDESYTASVLSEGNLWIIIVVAVLAIGAVVVLIIVKKKKKLATPNDACVEDEK